MTFVLMHKPEDKNCLVSPDLLMENQQEHIYEFGPFRIDTRANALFREESRMALTHKAFELLLIFAENSGRLLEKETLLKRLWPDSFVEEANLTQNIYTLRKILGDGPDRQHYI